MKNNSGKDISLIRGLARFYNQEGTLIKQIMFNRTEPLKMNEEVNEIQFWPFEVGNPRDSIVKFTPNKLTVVWLPETIEFANGEKVSSKQ